jgi:hypothetical protein
LAPAGEGRSTQNADSKRCENPNISSYHGPGAYRWPITGFLELGGLGIRVLTEPRATRRQLARRLRRFSQAQSPAVAAPVAARPQQLPELDLMQMVARNWEEMTVSGRRTT